MKSHYFAHFIITLALSFFSLNSYAAQWYHVELIVFEQLNTVTDEQWPEMVTSSDSKKVLQLIRPVANETLLSSASRLARSSSYRVHYHHAWQQSIMRKRSAQAISIDSENKMVEGSIKLYKSTYLHAALDLWLKENSADINSWSDLSPEGENINGVRNPHLKESRRVRSKKLYFFDHPKLGALLQLTPIETPISAQEKEKLQSFSLPTEAASTVAE